MESKLLLKFLMQPSPLESWERRSLRKLGNFVLRACVVVGVVLTFAAVYIKVDEAFAQWCLENMFSQSWWPTP